MIYSNFYSCKGSSWFIDCFSSNYRTNRECVVYKKYVGFRVIFVLES